MITKFKVGDIVIGNEKANRYRITKPGWIGKVIKLYNDGHIDVSKTNGNCMEYIVLPECFDLLETSNAVSEQTEKEFEDMIFG